MLPIYCLDLIVSAIFIYLVWQRYNFAVEGPFFIFFYSFSRGIAVAINLLLTVSNATHVSARSRSNWLAVYSALQVIVIIVDIVFHGFRSGDLWTSGYIFIIHEAAMAIIYMRRFIFLREIEKLALTEAETE